MKIFYAPDDLERRLAGLGWNGHVHSSGRFFVYGAVSFDGRTSAA